MSRRFQHNWKPPAHLYASAILYLLNPLVHILAQSISSDTFSVFIGAELLIVVTSLIYLIVPVKLNRFHKFGDASQLVVSFAVTMTVGITHGLLFAFVFAWVSSSSLFLFFSIMSGLTAMISAGEMSYLLLCTQLVSLHPFVHYRRIGHLFFRIILFVSSSLCIIVPGAFHFVSFLLFFDTISSSSRSIAMLLTSTASLPFMTIVIITNCRFHSYILCHLVLWTSTILFSISAASYAVVLLNASSALYWVKTGLLSLFIIDLVAAVLLFVTILSLMQSQLLFCVLEKRGLPEEMQSLPQIQCSKIRHLSRSQKTSVYVDAALEIDRDSSFESEVSTVLEESDYSSSRSRRISQSITEVPVVVCPAAEDSGSCELGSKRRRVSLNVVEVPVYLSSITLVHQNSSISPKHIESAPMPSDEELSARKEQ